MRSPSIAPPGIHATASAASRRFRRTWLSLNGVRYAGLLGAAAMGAAAFLWRQWGWSMTSWFIVGAVVLGTGGELLLLLLQPERDWRAARAVAESLKTLSWRYAMRGSPFETPDDRVADALFHARISRVLSAGADRLDLGTAAAEPTESMRRLRAESFGTRRAAYLEHRCGVQLAWYESRAAVAARRATTLSVLMLAMELLVIVVAVAVAAASTSLPIDVVAVLSAVAISAAGFFGLMQWGALAATYRVAANELRLQNASLVAVSEGDWATAVAVAEDAIGRERTLWLARSGVPSVKGMQGGGA